VQGQTDLSLTKHRRVAEHPHKGRCDPKLVIITEVERLSFHDRVVPDKCKTSG